MFNSSVTGTTDGEGLVTFVRDAGERIVAVICGHTWGGYCETREFWPEESHRGRDLGTRLPRAAEQEARRRGCRQIFLVTFTSQASVFSRSAALKLWRL